MNTFCDGDDFFSKLDNEFIIKDHDKIISAFGNLDSVPENFSFSGLIASQTPRAYKKIFTISYVTVRSVGIGAYLNKLGERIIQKKGSQDSKR